MKTYRYVGPQAIADRYGSRSAGTPIMTADELLTWVRGTAGRGGMTSTYVVDSGGVLRLADRHSEHVACAGGQDVLAAGEITLSHRRGTVSVEGISNLSTGYCPEPESWPAVAAALTAAGVIPPDGYSPAFEFRRCPSCGTTNVIKDDVLECGACGSALPAHWNFDRQVT